MLRNPAIDVWLCLQLTFETANYMQSYTIRYNRIMHKVKSDSTVVRSQTFNCRKNNLIDEKKSVSRTRKPCEMSEHVRISVHFSSWRPHHSSVLSCNLLQLLLQWWRQEIRAVSMWTLQITEAAVSCLVSVMGLSSVNRNHKRSQYKYTFIARIRYL